MQIKPQIQSEKKESNRLFNWSMDRCSARSKTKLKGRAVTMLKYHLQTAARPWLWRSPKTPPRYPHLLQLLWTTRKAPSEPGCGRDLFRKALIDRGLAVTLGLIHPIFECGPPLGYQSSCI